jgi:hypothetical protein
MNAVNTLFDLPSPESSMNNGICSLRSTAACRFFSKSYFEQKGAEVRPFST